MPWGALQRARSDWHGCVSDLIGYLGICDCCIVGVEDVQTDCDNNKITVIGKVNPVKIKDKLEEKTKNKVEIISPLPKKDTNSEKKAEMKAEVKAEVKAEKKVVVVEEEKKPKSVSLPTHHHQLLDLLYRQFHDS